MLNLFKNKPKPQPAPAPTQKKNDESKRFIVFEQAASFNGMEKIQLTIGTYKPTLDGIAELKKTKPDGNYQKIEFRPMDSGWAMFVDGFRAGAIFSENDDPKNFEEVCVRMEQRRGEDRPYLYARMRK